MSRSKYERDLINAIHKKRKLEPQIESEFALFQKILPALREVIRTGGGPDQILKKSESVAAMTLLESTQSEKEEIRLKAATEILNRTMGKPIERSVNVYGDISKMSEADVDHQIMSLLDRTNSKKLLETTLGLPKKKRKKLQSRKPRISDPLVIDGTATEVKGPISPGETATSSDPQN